MAIVTSLLVKYRGGYVTVETNTTTLGRREGFLSFDVSTADQATALATLVLAGVAVSVFQGQVEIIPTPGVAAQIPQSGFQIGDRINVPTADLTSTNWQRVVGLSLASMDDDGNVGVVPELGQFNDEREQKIQRAVRRMLLGTLNGDSNAAVTARIRQSAAQKHRQKPDPLVFSWAGALVSGTISPRWYIRTPVVAKLLTISVQTAGSTDTVVDLSKNGVAWATLTLTTGVEKATVAILDRLELDDYLDAIVTTAGTGAEDLTVQIDMVGESEPPTTESAMI